MRPRIKNAFSTVDLLSDRFLKLIATKLFLNVTIIWFTFQSVYMAFFTKVGLPPDENWHIGLIKLYTIDGIDPFIQNQEGYYFLGDVTRNTSFMYHYLLSFVYRVLDLVGLDDYEIIVLRLANVIIALLTVWVITKICRLLPAKKWVQNVAIFMITNTMMFVYLASSIQYDNLLNLFAAASLYYYVLLINKISLKNLIGLSLSTLLALLTKNTFLPIALMLYFSLIFISRHDSASVVRRLRKELNLVNWRSLKVLLLFSFFGLLVLLAGERYIVNLVNYGRVDPKCQQVIQIEKCKEAAIFRRNLEISNNRPSPEKLISQREFIIKWLVEMQDRTFGVFGHESFKPFNKITYALSVVFVVFTIAVIRKASPRDKQLYWLLLVATAYYLILLIINRGSYERSGIFGLALQGRYGLPVLFIFYIAGLHYISKITTNKFVNFLTASFIITAFFVSSLPTYYIKTDDSWRPLDKSQHWSF